MNHPRCSHLLPAIFMVVAVPIVLASMTVSARPAPVPASVTALPQWPAAPQPARIRFVQSVEDASDWGLARGWWGRAVDSITGRREQRFVRPTGVAERDGVLYVADPGAQCVVILDRPRRKELRLTRAGDRLLQSPVALTPGSRGSVYVVDSHARSVLQLGSDGSLLKIITATELQRPSSVAFDESRGRLYVGDSKAHTVHLFDEDGRRSGAIGHLGEGPGEFNSPTHLALRPDGHLVVTDALNFRVQVFDTEGRFIRETGEAGDGAGSFSSPKGVAVDPAGHLYVADAMFDAIQVFDEAGRLLLGFGGQGVQAGQFWLPNGLFIGPDQRLYVADAYNRRVQVFEIFDPTPSVGHDVTDRAARP
jgi:DNA-binding beta-propeller fold protein YncE